MSTWVVRRSVSPLAAPPIRRWSPRSPRRTARSTSEERMPPGATRSALTRLRVGQGRTSRSAFPNCSRQKRISRLACRKPVHARHASRSALGTSRSARTRPSSLSRESRSVARTATSAVCEGPSARRGARSGSAVTRHSHAEHWAGVDSSQRRPGRSDKQRKERQTWIRGAHPARRAPTFLDGVTVK